MNKFVRPFLLILVLIAIIGSITYLEGQKESPSTQAGGPATVGSPYQDFQNPSAFINSEAFTLSEYIGKKIILVDFWTYSCINCIRTQPYLNAWWESYEDDGLLIVGIHSPEFEFEKVLANVEAAVQKEGIAYPVILDNEKSTWNAYGNRYWPRKYLIDLEGNIVYDHIGEGNYDETELKIQELLGITGTLASEKMDLTEPNFEEVLSKETYFGSQRATNLAFTSIEPISYSPNLAYLVGGWEQGPESVLNLFDEASITFSYTAKNVYIVASGTNSVTGTGEVEVELWLDGEYLKTVTIGAETLYPLIEGENYQPHVLKLIPKTPGLEVFTFTFG